MNLIQFPFGRVKGNKFLGVKSDAKKLEQETTEWLLRGTHQISVAVPGRPKVTSLSEWNAQ